MPPNPKLGERCQTPSLLTKDGQSRWLIGQTRKTFSSSKPGRVQMGGQVFKKNCLRGEILKSGKLLISGEFMDREDFTRHLPKGTANLLRGTETYKVWPFWHSIAKVGL